MRPAVPSRSARERARAIGGTCVCFGLRRAARVVTQIYDDQLRPAGIRATQFALLALVSGVGPVNVTRLAALAGMDYTTLVRNVALLERDGLLLSRRGGDGRVRELSLTRRGENTLERALPLWRKAQEHVARAIGPKVLGRLLSELSTTATISLPT